MDKPLSVSELAMELGTTQPRVYRAVRRGMVRPIGGEGRRPLRFGCDAVVALRDAWGWVPRSPRRQEGATGAFQPTREDLLVLAAVSRHPLGLRSARAVARLAGISPTTACRSLGRLAASGMVCRRVTRVVEGTVRDIQVWTMVWRSPARHALMTDIGRTMLPSPPGLPPSNRIPARLRHLFWDTDWRQLRTDRNGPYIVDRILRMNDLPALAWMVTAIDAVSLRRGASRRGLTLAQRRLAVLIAESR